MSTSSINYDSIINSNAITMTLAALATSSTLLVGRQSAIIDNTTALYEDFQLMGQITVGGPTITVDKSIQVWLFGLLKVASGSFNYPVATATELAELDAARTFEQGQLNALRLVNTITVNATNDRKYPISILSVAAAFGGIVPMKFGLFITHDTGAALNATPGNHWMHWTGVKHTSAA